MRAEKNTKALLLNGKVAPYKLVLTANQILFLRSLDPSDIYGLFKGAASGNLKKNLSIML